MMKNIVIQSESNDLSTQDVINWVKYLRPSQKITTVFDEYQVDTFSLQLSNENYSEIVINDKVTLNKNTLYWYRRGVFSCKFDREDAFLAKIQRETFEPYINFLETSNFSNSINKFQDQNVEKLKMLYEAIELNINIPEVLVTNNKEQLKKFVKKNGKVICKSIKNPFVRFYEKDYTMDIAAATEIITIEENDPDYFNTSFFQKYIDKKFEIRSFYFDGNFYSMAIFSQQNEKTKIDFRNYDIEKPNRLIPFKIPNDLESKLTQLMKKLDLNCGSFDLIYTPEKEYYFLEVNPIGQFQWLSRNCNYYLEKEIAKSLMKYE